MVAARSEWSSWHSWAGKVIIMKDTQDISNSRWCMYLFQRDTLVHIYAILYYTIFAGSTDILSRYIVSSALVHPRLSIGRCDPSPTNSAYSTFFRCFQLAKKRFHSILRRFNSFKKVLSLEKVNQRASPLSKLLFVHPKVFPHKTNSEKRKEGEMKKKKRKEEKEKKRKEKKERKKSLKNLLSATKRN